MQINRNMHDDAIEKMKYIFIKKNEMYTGIKYCSKKFVMENTTKLS